MNYVVYGSARSGTTFLCEWLFPYLYDELDYDDWLNEYFTFTDYDMRWSFDGLNINDVGNHQSTIESRLSWLKQSPRKYLIKHISLHDRSDVIEYLRQSHVIVVNRRNKWQQILSYGIAVNSGLWYSISPMAIQKLNIVFTRDQFDWIASLINQSIETASTFSSQTSIDYEDFCQNPHELLDRLGLPRKDYNAKPLSMKVNHRHEVAFSNINEVRGWYEEWASES